MQLSTFHSQNDKLLFQGKSIWLLYPKSNTFTNSFSIQVQSINIRRVHCRYRPRNHSHIFETQYQIQISLLNGIDRVNWAVQDVSCGPDFMQRYRLFRMMNGKWA